MHCLKMRGSLRRYIGIAQSPVNYFGSATRNQRYLRSRCAILVAFDDFFVAEGKWFTFAGAALAALANWLPSRTNDDKYCGSTASGRKSDCFRIEALPIECHDFSVAEPTLTSGVIRHSST